jgi:flagellin-like hook-associated protein FlgL
VNDGGGATTGRGFTRNYGLSFATFAMARIAPVPTTRVSDILANLRLQQQLQADQRDLFRLQSSISSGQRISLPSEDAPAARRAISIQRLLERKEQVQTNFLTNQSYLSATDNALAGVSGQLADMRGLALSVIGTTTTDTQRQAAIKQIDEALQGLTDVGNQKFRGRYLFTGSQTTVQPFEFDGTFLRYSGNEKDIRAFADVDLLTETNVNGNAVFGAISAEVLGTADLNPILTANTRLADLLGGSGVADGSILISDGTTSVTIDISSAETIGDLAGLIERNPPAGNTMTVSVTGNGLSLQLGSGNLTVLEVGGGITADQLGILKEVSGSTSFIVGTDLNPKLRLTTSTQDILGVRAEARYVSSGLNNDLFIEADTRGAALNGISVTFVDNAGISAGNETVVYNAGAKTLVINIDADNTTANDIINLFNTDAGVKDLFTVRLDARDTTLSAAAGTGTIQINPPGPAIITTGGSGIEFDQTGLRIVNGGETFNVSFTTANTIEDILNILNASDANVLAEINATGTGINLRSRLSGTDFSIGENGGTTATDLGVRSFRTDTRLEDLNHGFGVHTYDDLNNTGNAMDFVIHRKDGNDLFIDVTGATTIQDVLDRINNHANNADNLVVAQLAAVGNGIELVTTDPSNIATFSVERVNVSSAAIDLGLIAIGNNTSAPPVVTGVETITGRDINPQEVTGVFTALLRLRQALLTNDSPQIGRAVEMLESSRDQVNFAIAEVGARQQRLDVLQLRLETDEVELRATLSQEIDVDLAEAISNLAGRQASFEASLRMAGNLFQLSLLNFI